MRHYFRLAATISLAATLSAPMYAQTFSFSTGPVTNGVATGSRPGIGGKIEIESADDFITGAPLTILNSATFTGLLTGATPTIGQVRVEIYRVFPKDSDTVRMIHVVTRANSPSDVAFGDRDSSTGNLTFSTTTLAASFTANNSVLNGINMSPNQTTFGEGPVTGQEVQFNVVFTQPFQLPADHYFFIPQVQITGGEFMWLSGTRPIPGTPINPDLQSWIRNANLDPDWSRIGTDIIGGATPPTFNGAFSLSGQAVPEPGSIALFAGATMTGAALLLRRRRTRKR